MAIEQEIHAWSIEGRSGKVVHLVARRLEAMALAVPEQEYSIDNNQHSSDTCPRSCEDMMNPDCS